jgi:hypothetical protein
MTGGRLLEPAHNDAITLCPTIGYNYFAVHGVIVGFRPNGIKLVESRFLIDS